MVQECSESVWLKNSLKERAVRAAHLLLTSDDVNAPDFDVMDMDVGDDSDNAKFREAHEQVFSNAMAQRRFERHTTFRLTSGQHALITSSINSVDLMQGAEHLDVIDELKKKHKDFINTVGLTLKLDAFELHDISEGRPLLVAAFRAMEIHHLFTELGINKAKFCHFVTAVEKG